mmetsp:Transcript_32324/g.69802  ORF Transcript_32324/g.69802 Transcript_32324/m.69802 type:complete len:94 (-) Transcript_32324:98-379(-)
MAMGMERPGESADDQREHPRQRSFILLPYESAQPFLAPTLEKCLLDVCNNDTYGLTANFLTQSFSSSPFVSKFHGPTTLSNQLQCLDVRSLHQ